MEPIDNVLEREQPPEPPVDRMESIERVLEGLIGVVNQQARNNQPPPIHEPHRDGLMSIKDFQKMKPPLFEGGIDPSKADDWELGMEKIFVVVNPAQCSEVHKVVLATYSLEGEAHRWWVQQRGREPNMTWARFLEVFHEKYYPQTIRDSKVSEFSELKHRNCLSVARYDKKFPDLSRFAPHMVATDAPRAQRFVEGLNDELRPQVKMLRLQTYVDVLNVSLMLESELAKVNGKSGGQQVKRTNYLLPVAKRGNNSFKKQNTSVFGRNYGSGSGGNNSRAPLCPKCGRFHRG
ncbi:hypothetical protein Vadar_029787 [Vaccinium darrowii]|uniref:Uncharacterized protein n=1 Tax=Vaccinium darrowii TaxID=229202 RepID=A0ACB7YQS9_9ERIC|nr:hypothetical protein Vadar_029787 [Vaccinium darrowii]